MSDTEEHYREQVLQAALMKKDVRAAIANLQRQANAIEHEVRSLRSHLEILLTYVND